MQLKLHQSSLSLRHMMAFSLTEMLIVISVIVALAGLLIPAINTARSAAKKADCMNRQRQTGMAMIIYTQEHKGIFPPWQDSDGNLWLFIITDGWSKFINSSINYKFDADYAAKFFCSEDPHKPRRKSEFESTVNGNNFSIGYNNNKLDKYKLISVLNPAETIMVGDSFFTGSNPEKKGFAQAGWNTYQTGLLYPWHTSGMTANITMVDGRVTSIKSTKAYDLQTLYRRVSDGGVGWVDAPPPGTSNTPEASLWGK